MKKFRGVSQLSLDAKGRIMLPARHREALSAICDSQLVITIDLNLPCLLIYPLDVWEKVEEQIDALPSFNELASRLRHTLLAHADDVSIDANGRLLLPSTHRQFANFDKKLVLVGQGKKFELWSEATWNEYRDKWLSEKNDGELTEALAEISI